MTLPAPQAPSAAWLMQGITLADGWTVGALVPAVPGGTGGIHSVGYHVAKNNSPPAFLKALDVASAFAHPQAPLIVQAMFEAFNFERQLLERCNAKGLNRIVRVLGSGVAKVPGAGAYPDVPYLIFEMAAEDARKYTALNQQLDMVFALRTLHQVATGLFQLHQQGIVHQDLKPSNVLIFPQEGSKLADLGRASMRGTPGPSDHMDIAGDLTYAPPELLYRKFDPDWHRRRQASDLYMFGSLVFFFVTRATMTAAIGSRLDPAHHWNQWPSDYQTALPYVRVAFDDCLRAFETACPPAFAAALSTIIRYSSEPDPLLRGHPRNKRASTTQFSLERSIAELNVLAKKAELGVSP